MLVFTRKLGDKVCIGDDVKVHVLSIVGDTIKLGINAPRRVPVHRGEVFEEIKRQQAEGSADEKTA